MAFDELKKLFENTEMTKLSWEKTTEKDEHNMYNEVPSSTSMQHARRRLFRDSRADVITGSRVPRKPDYNLFRTRKDESTSE